MANNLFGNNNEKFEKQFSQKVDSQAKTILKLIERQKNLEENLDLLNEKYQMLDHNSVENFKKYFNKIKEIREEIKNIKLDIENIKENQKKIVKQLKITATKDDVSKLEKYIDFWEPLNFVTREEFDEFKTKLKKELIEKIEKFLEN
jgi:seryl-tRNA synthetase